MRAATNDLTGALQRGLFEEEANRNLDAAAQAYQAVSAQFDKDRKLAATAIFRLGEVYRKQGKTNEAVAQYERIVREFPDEQTLATLSRQNLAGLQSTVISSGSGGSSRGGASLSASQSDAAILKKIRGLSFEEQRQVLPMLVPDELLAQLLKTQQSLETDRALLGPGHPDLSMQDAALKKVDEQIAQRIKGIIQALEIRAATVSASEVTAYEQKVAQLVTPTDDEEKEIRRIQEIIRNSPDLVDAPSGEDKLTPLCRAARNGHLRVAKFLLDGSAAIDRRSNGSTPLHYAVTGGHRAMTDFLLERGADVNARDVAGRTPLHIAAENGFQLVAEGLVARKADINPVTSKQEAPLHLAAGKGHTELTKFLISKGAELDAKDESDRTALSLAAARGHSESVTALLEAKANPNLEDKQGRTPLSYAAEAGHLNSVKPLLESKADPNAGRISLPLHAAIHRKSPAVIEALLQGGANVNARSRGDGRTALHEAVKRNSKDLTELLLSSGADPNIRDHEGRTPLDYAKNLPRPAQPPGSTARDPLSEIAALLRQHGALDDLPDFTSIGVRRPSANYSWRVFLKSTNDWNHYTLLDTLASLYFSTVSTGSKGLTFSLRHDPPFPDLHRIVVVRPSSKPGQPPKRIPVDLILPTGAVDCTKNLPLEFGDVVEIPEREHTLLDSPVGLSTDEAEQILQCGAGTVSLLVRGNKTELRIVGHWFDALVWRVLERQEVRSALFSSSDLSRVKVTRRVPASGKKHEWIVDCTGGKNPDLWLRDGDVIEVPDKP